ncbi:ParB/RepB/Spo0J family partition protein (plasmid) [Streptomyces sp. BI20]|uniref:ParB/RepB/Spo0J family partition protein n=1 Tax=Streptomyces sp. BI20 TaxID=3403460 RepID=UPI003C78C2F6
MSKADRLGGSATFDAVAQPMSSRAASFARFAGQDTPQPAAPPAGPTPRNSPRLPVADIAHNPYNPREELREIEDLADSLAARGAIQPVTVVTRDAFLAAHPGHESSIGEAGYIVVDGNRRLAAANLAGLDDLPVHLDDSLATDADTLLETALVAAIQHRDLEPLEQAQALQTLVDKYGSQRKVATALHKSSGWVTQRLALLKLTPELQQAVEDRTLPVEVARKVGRLPQQQQQNAVDEALAVREAERAERRREPAPEEAGGAAAGPSAYAVSTPEAPEPTPAQPAHTAVPASTTPAEPARTAPPTADARPGADREPASTAPKPAHTGRPGERASTSSASPAPTGGVLEQPEDEEDGNLVDIRRLTRMPWHDGHQVADLVLEKMAPAQRAVLLERLMAALDS